MPHILDTPTRAQTVCAAVTRLILSGGMSAVTTRAIAAESGVAARVAHVRDQERLLLEAVLGRRFDRTTLDCTHAMIDGLRVAVCATEDSMPVEQARRALQLGLGRLGGGA